MVLMVNGRIRESVGATHFDMADILLNYGMDKAMGFDPGGSSTLVVGGEMMNISPYNKNYEKDIYSLPPEPRFVANTLWGGLRRKGIDTAGITIVFEYFESTQYLTFEI